jgi:hypothetical protein
VSSSQLPNEVRQFIGRHIISIEQLEVLLLVSGTPDRSWTAEEVFVSVRSSRGSVAARLEELTKQGFLQGEPAPNLRYKYAPASRDLASGVDALKKEYQEKRVKVIEAIFSKSEEQIRNFSDAFRLKKDE